MMVNSKRKGNNGEREFAKLCRFEGYDTRRGQQYHGLEGEDIVGLDGVHVEVKRVQRLNVDAAMLQSIADANGKMPIVAHRKNHCEWLITMRFSDWINLFREWECHNGNN